MINILSLNDILNNIPDIYKEYTGTWFVIKDKQILGCYNSFNDAVRQTCKSYELGTFCVEYYEDSENTCDFELVMLPKFKYNQNQLSKRYSNLLSNKFIPSLSLE